MMGELLSLPVQIQAALIGAAAALVVVLLRDLLGPLFLDALRERRERRKAALAVYGAYADPLAATTEYLFWRLREIFYEPSRAVYLKLPEPNTEYQL